MRLRIFVAAAALLAASLAAIPARADSIVFDSKGSSAHVYSYDLDIPQYLFEAGSTITFTGLADVTGASSAYSDLFFDASYTSTTVTFTTNFENQFGSDITNLFTIDSTASSAGSVTYSAEAFYPDNDTYPIVTGNVEGPVAGVAPTPEPASFVLLGTGLLGVVGVVRRRLV